MKELLSGGYLHGDCLTVTGQTVADNLKKVPSLTDLPQQVRLRPHPLPSTRNLTHDSVSTTPPLRLLSQNFFSSLYSTDVHNKLKPFKFLSPPLDFYNISSSQLFLSLRLASLYTLSSITAAVLNPSTAVTIIRQFKVTTSDNCLYLERQKC